MTVSGTAATVPIIDVLLFAKASRSRLRKHPPGVGGGGSRGGSSQPGLLGELVLSAGHAPGSHITVWYGLPDAL